MGSSRRYGRIHRPMPACNGSGPLAPSICADHIVVSDQLAVHTVSPVGNIQNKGLPQRGFGPVNQWQIFHRPLEPKFLALQFGRFDLDGFAMNMMDHIVRDACLGTSFFQSDKDLF